MLTATYLTNRTASHSLGNQSPLQLISQHIHPIKFGNDLPQRVFGFECYVHLYPNQTDKLSPKAIKCVFIWYSNVQKGYKCYFPSNKRIIVSCYVIFNELNMFYHKDQNQIETSAPNQSKFLLQPEISHTYIRTSVPRNDNTTKISAPTSESTDIDDGIQNFSKAPTYDQVYIRKRKKTIENPHTETKENIPYIMNDDSQEHGKQNRKTEITQGDQLSKTLAVTTPYPLQNYLTFSKATHQHKASLISL